MLATLAATALLAACAETPEPAADGGQVDDVETDDGGQVDDGSDDPGSDDDAGPGGDPDQQPVGEPEQLRSPEGLTDQLRTLFPPSTAEDDLGLEPGTTEWRSAELPDGLEERYDSLGALAFDLADARHGDSMGADLWESTVRVLLDDEDPDQAYVAVLSWGLADDATIGRDLRVTVTATEDGGWSPGGAEERSHCSRGVVDDGCN